MRCVKPLPCQTERAHFGPAVAGRAALGVPGSSDNVAEELCTAIHGPNPLCFEYGPAVVAWNCKRGSEQSVFACSSYVTTVQRPAPACLLLLVTAKARIPGIQEDSCIWQA
eukprot:5851961-Pleurochrysis_carterae.AAC.7